MRQTMITLRTNFDSDVDERNHEIMLEAVRLAAKTLFTQARLLSGQPPQVVIESGDLFVKPEDVALFAEGEDL